jgi:hypothetical protein
MRCSVAAMGAATRSMGADGTSNDRFGPESGTSGADTSADRRVDTRTTRTAAERQPKRSRGSPGEHRRASVPPTAGVDRHLCGVDCQNWHTSHVDEDRRGGLHRDGRRRRELRLWNY